MKIKNLILICFIFLVSCNQEESIIDNPQSAIELRSASGMNPIDEIAGIQVHLKIPSLTHNSKFLSARQSNREPCLYHVDDNSGRQKWLIEKVGTGYMIKAVSGVKNNWLHLGLKAEETQGVWPRMQSYYTASNMLWDFDRVGNTNLYRVSIRSKNKNTEVYLSAMSATKTDDLILSKMDNSGLQLWEIEAIETFEIENISYEVNSADYIKAKPSFISKTTAINNTSVAQTMSIVFQERASESSSFSKTTSISTTIAAGGKVGIPLLAEGSLNMSNTTSKSWTYGSSETKEDSRSYSFNIIAPPNTTVTAKAIVAMYDVSVTYIATLRGRTSGKQVKLSGVWQGIKASDITYELTESKSGVVLKTIKGTPSSTIDLSKAQ